MQAVSDLESVGATPSNGYGRRVTNRVDAFLLAGLEEGDAGDDFPSSRSDSGNQAVPLHSAHRQGAGLEEPTQFRKPIPAADTTDSLPSLPQPGATRRAHDVQLSSEDLLNARDWMPFFKKLLARLSWFLTVELAVGLIMLAPTIATIAVNVPHPYIEPVIDASAPPAPPAPPQLGARVDTTGIFLLILRPMYALLAARLVSLLLSGFFRLPDVQRLLPGIVLLVLHHAFHMEWAMPAALYPAAIALFFGVRLDRDAWTLLFGIQHLLALAFWLMAAGLCSVLLDAGVALWQSQLTVQHYENRSHSAYFYHKGLKKIAAAARAAQRREEKAMERRRKDDAAAALLQAQIRALAQRRAADARRQATAATDARRLAAAATDARRLAVAPEDVALRHSSPMRAWMKQGTGSSKSRPSHPSSNLSVSNRIDEAPSAIVDKTGSAPAAPPAEAPPPPVPDAPAALPVGPAVRPPPPLLPAKSSQTVSAAKLASRGLSGTSEDKPARTVGRQAADELPRSGQPAEPPPPPPPPGKKEPPRAGGIKAQTLEKRLNALSGPFDFGSDISSASTIEQARRRAVRLFNVVLEQPELRVSVPEGGSPAVDRDKLMAWAYAEANKPPPRNIASEIFAFGPAVDEEQFIKVVERSYTEQRLLTASVEAFDRLHSNVRIFLQVMLLLIFLVILLAVWSISIVNWLLPLGSALLTVAVLAGGITADVLDSFFFAYIIRPYDIGDRVTIAAPGQPPALFSMVVKDVFLMRTHFYACNGDSLMINNSSLRRMGITNLNRSGPITMLVELMVPAATPAAKMNELSDAIVNYCTSSNEWAGAELQYASTHFDLGHMMLRIWCETCYAAHEVGPMHGAKSRLLLFCHAYMQSAGIEYLQPILPVRPDRANVGSAQQSLASLFDKSR